MQSIDTRRLETSADKVVERVRAAVQKHDIEGISLIGGEPFLQARDLASVARACREMKLSVLTFTGYTRKELEKIACEDDIRGGAAELLAATDLLIDGPFMADELEEERNWVGSRNQVFHFLTDAYKPGIEYDSRYRHTMEVRILANGVVKINGWPFMPGLLEAEGRIDLTPRGGEEK
jgi:anaerobic ribonucleoside-triphosphate reductase activating protein